MLIYEARLEYKCVGSVEYPTCNSAHTVVEYLRDAFDDFAEQEQIWVILLNRKNRALGRIRVSIGSGSNAILNPSEVFRPAIMAGAATIIIAHNHPTGDTSPSSADIKITQQMKQACQIMNIGLLDHVIVGDNAYYSFSESGLL